MTSILVVEDDGTLRETLATTLTVHGYDVMQASTAEEAVVIAGMDMPDLILLDLSLPRADGFYALERLRSFSTIPIIVVTVRQGKDDKVAALDRGADDYVVKPFDVDELLARIRAALRRGEDHGDAPAVVHAGAIVFDRARGRVWRDNEEVHLTPTELRLLDLLVQSDGRLITYTQVAHRLRTPHKEVDQAALRVYVGQLRRKLGDDAADPRLIVTHFGLGYQWIAAESGG